MATHIEKLEPGIRAMYERWLKGDVQPGDPFYHQPWLIVGEGPEFADAMLAHLHPDYCSETEARRRIKWQLNEMKKRQEQYK